MGRLGDLGVLRMTKTNKNQIKVPKNVQSKTAIANDQRKHWICVWVEMNYHFKNIRLIKGITNEKHYIFSKSLCSFLKTGKLNVRDIISWLSFDSPSESEFSITHEFSLFHLTTLGSDKFLSSYTNTIYKENEICSQELFKPSSMYSGKRKSHCTLITEKWLASIPCILETLEQVRILLFHRSWRRIWFQQN